jgi:hypothetical protein
MPDLKKQLTERFVKAIRKSFTPCPLIGPKWLQSFPYGRPADFRFFGIPRLTKAIGLKQSKIIEIVMRHFDVSDLPVRMEINDRGLIDFHRTDLSEEQLAQRRQREQERKASKGKKSKPDGEETVASPPAFRADSQTTANTSH